MREHSVLSFSKRIGPAKTEYLHFDLQYLRGCSIIPNLCEKKLGSHSEILRKKTKLNTEVVFVGMDRQF